jgi:hypothetical protein
MAVHPEELALVTPDDLAVYGVMQEAYADVSGDKVAARVAAAIDEVLSWIPNCARPIVAIGPYLKKTIGLLASEQILRWDRGVTGRDETLLDGLRSAIERERALISTAGDRAAVRLSFVDSTPNVDDFATVGGGSVKADGWVLT